MSKRTLSDDESDNELEQKHHKMGAGSNQGGYNPSSSSMKRRFDDSNAAGSEASYQKKVKESAASFTSDFAAKMLAKMGYQQGKGLGKEQQGIAEPIKESEHIGTRGLGFEKKHFEKRVESWDYENDPATATETPLWISNINLDEMPSLDLLRSWKKIGPKKRILDDEDTFCSKQTLAQVLDCKSVFDNLDDREMRNARSRANPYEKIGGRYFQNRAALKMANIDAVFDYMFTEAKRIDGSSLLGPNDLLYFCDVCAGPGGFSEYVLWRKNMGYSKGFGFTLKDSNDFKLSDFVAGQPEYFEPFYGENGIHGDGDVTKRQNLIEFRSFVEKSTDGEGVHFVMADGGFSVEGNENIQEILSKQLYLCQFLSALSVLRAGGNFVCKLFDLFTPFSVGLIYLMYTCFDRICIHKPVTSRPANSERYIICQGARETVKDIVHDYLFEINETLNETFRVEETDDDVVSIVPIEIIKQDQAFFDYIYQSNESLGDLQVLNLKKIQAFATNRNLHDMRQSQLIEDCLAYWNIPLNKTRLDYADRETYYRMRSKPHYQIAKLKITNTIANPQELVADIDFKLQNSWKVDLNTMKKSKPRELVDSSSMTETFKRCSIYDYKCFVGCGKLVLLLGCGRTTVYELELESYSSTARLSQGAWKLLESHTIELPKGTLLLADICQEYEMNRSSGRNTIHVIDVLFVEGENVMYNQMGRVQSIEDRKLVLDRFLRSVRKYSRNDLDQMRIKDLIDVESIEKEILGNLEERSSRSSRNLKYGIHVPIRLPSENYIHPTGIYFLKQVQSPWSIVKSKKTQKLYYYNCESGESSYDANQLLYAHPISYWESSLVWRWLNHETVFNEQYTERHQPHSLTKSEFMQALKSIRGV